jgi:hypothetical protein
MVTAWRRTIDGVSRRLAALAQRCRDPRSTGIECGPEGITAGSLAPCCPHQVAVITVPDQVQDIEERHIRQGTE